ncbi:ectonucleotide pyrophosphatase/phosphodiesterase [Bacteriovorax sp. Seq25_V]|uniref:alkaline phosphatase family protein n=1 Tax=Bacteriovorax sp. Seq25_V TaxID=1201288 RepID=UPI000389F63F|nr:ectonucleotide pyrophosphatase/phosphodiesterase [Bacteriovorax sp. Seq25_V]EQC43798.1 type I phosphodiesterase/nucleotide pyrophosphatase [Bacteriovorax sp. Seq25_V]
MKKYFCLLLTTLTLFSCNKQEKTKLLVISIDGYRHDYTELYSPPFLTKFSNEGARLRSLRPSFPTKTFPNHLSIMTGVYPMNHGIIANHFYAPDLEKRYSLKDRSSVTDGRFYKALPFWALAKKNGIKSATLFWPGSEAEVLGYRPDFYLDYEHTMPHEARISKVLEWLSDKTENAPQFLTLYFSDVDSAGHKFGPEAQETREAVLKVDRSIESLLSQALKIEPNLNIIVLSDHGMQALVAENKELLFKKSNDYIRSLYFIEGHGPISHLYKKSNIVTNISKDIEAINKTAKNFKCYSPMTTPKQLKFHSNVRIGDIVCIADDQWNIILNVDDKLSLGNHGWNQHETNDMDAIFYAKGPKFKTSYVHKSVDNINIYPLFAYIFGIKIDHGIDGNFAPIMGILKQ